MKIFFGVVLVVAAGFVFPDWRPKSRGEFWRVVFGMVLALGGMDLIFSSFH